MLYDKVLCSININVGELLLLLSISVSVYSHGLLFNNNNQQSFLVFFYDILVKELLIDLTLGKM